MKKKISEVRLRTYLYAVVCFILLTVVFLSFMQIDALAYFFTANEYNEHNRYVYNKQVEQFVSLVDNEGEVATKDDRFTVVIGSLDYDTTNIVNASLTNLREDYLHVENYNTLQFYEDIQADVYIITEKFITASQIEELYNSSEEKTIIFMDSLSPYVLQDENVLDIIGADEYIGETEFTGYRISGELAFNEYIQDDEIEFTASEFTLNSGTKTYAYTLSEDEEIENQDLPPLMWRYIKENTKTYICESEIFSTTLANAVLIEVYSQFEEVYIYPIINASTYLVNSMPYVTNISTDYMTELYGKDSLHVQNDVFFPYFNSVEVRYNLALTWFSPEYDAVLASDNSNITYYTTQMLINANELAQSVESVPLSDSVAPTTVVEWDEHFDFYNTETEMVNLPVLHDYINFYDKIIDVNSLVKSAGYASVYVDVRDFMQESEYDWVDFSLDNSSVLNYYQLTYPWLENVTAEEAASRVLTFLTIEPTYSTSGNEATLSIDNFVEKAYFIMDTGNTIVGISGGEYTEIGTNLYLIHAMSSEVKIIFEENL